MIIRQMTLNDVAAVSAIKQKYAQAYPEAQVVPCELYLSPAFHAGQDVFCAYDGARLLAYAPLYLQLVEDDRSKFPTVAWVEIQADPELPDPWDVKDALYHYILSRAWELTNRLPDRPLRMSFQYRPSESSAIDYVQSKGFVFTESLYSMERKLAFPIPNPPVTAGINLRHHKMESESEQVDYVTARNECFPEAPISLGEWQYFLSSPFWAAGTTIAAFDDETLVGNVAVFWNDEEEVKVGYTEYIFVRPAWRGRGIAQAMIVEGMRYLKDHGINRARLEVRALNEKALGMYKKLGYQVLNESRFYTKLFVGSERYI